ncbi:hypothetical protein MTR67_025971 [Solanum verrucosum]|uniref:Uncharacterized protein n=1 Tax=Solanum verrucosum TaxID=315347 RepID=A0AAF0TU12_SOLVR|nr:hypothetical protein MTR67_025971 [Solanum verrucosum]
MSPCFRSTWQMSPSCMLSLESVVLGLDLSFEEEPRSILDRQVRKLRTKEIALVKVQRKHHFVGEVTSETQSDMCAIYPQLFKALAKADSQKEDYPLGGVHLGRPGLALAMVTYAEPGLLK